MASSNISVRKQIKDFKKNLDKFQREQLPYAVSIAINEVAKKVRDFEYKGFANDLGKKTPFTMKAIGINFSRKNNLTATIFVKPIQAAYLEPSEDGGKQVLLPVLNPTNIAVLTPKAAQILNQYGNIPRNKIAQLRKNPNVFIGPVKTKNGTIYGVWERQKILTGRIKRKATKRDLARFDPEAFTEKLSLLVRFTNPVMLKKKLHYAERAKAMVDLHMDIELSKAFAMAWATRK